jgi:hypothetical protein
VTKRWRKGGTEGKDVDSKMRNQMRAEGELKTNTSKKKKGGG